MLSSEITFYHSRPLEYAIPEVVEQVPDPEDPDFEAAYRWLEKEIGFYGVFLAVGDQENALTYSGYRNQFRRSAPSKHQNQVLFGYESLLNVRYTDYMNWHIVLNSVEYPKCVEEPPIVRNITHHDRRLILKPSWKESNWLRKAHQDELDVQGHVVSLDLAGADIIWCRNNPTRQTLIERGFEADKIEVRRVPVEQNY